MFREEHFSLFFYCLRYPAITTNYRFSRFFGDLKQPRRLAGAPYTTAPSLALHNPFPISSFNLLLAFFLLSLSLWEASKLTSFICTSFFLRPPALLPSAGCPFTLVFPRAPFFIYFLRLRYSFFARYYKGILAFGQTRCHSWTTCEKRLHFVLGQIILSKRAI